MYRVWYTPHGGRPEVEIGTAIVIDAAKALAREALVQMNISMFLYADTQQGIERNREDWRPLAESSVQLAWREEENGVVIGEGYDGGSIVVPSMKIIRIEPIAEASDGDSN